MKKYLSLLLLCIVMMACDGLTTEERDIKKHITMYLEDNLHDPSSLKDLEITYAIVTDTVHDLCLAAISRGEKADYAGSVEGHVIAIIEYRAKNAYGTYRKGEDIVTYNDFVAELMGTHGVERIKQGHAYIVDFNAFDWKTIK